MRAVSSGTGGTGCGRRSDMGDLWTRKSSNALAPHKAADFANGVRDTVGELVGYAASAAKREMRVGASGRPANQAATRSRLRAAAVATCCRRVLARPR